jgi:gluconolactonase
MKQPFAVSLAFLLVACSSSATPRPPATTGGSTGSGGSSGSGGTGGSPGTGGAISPTGGTGGTPSPSPDAAADGPTTPDAATAKDGGAADGAVVKSIPPSGNSCPAGPFGNPLPASTVATLVKGPAGSLEGPVWVASQNALYYCVVVGAKGGRIDKFVPSTMMVTPFVTGLDVAGLAVSPDGSAIVAAAFDNRDISKFDLATGARTTVAGSNIYMGKPFKQMNDVVVRSDGNYYFTDTDYQQNGRPGQDVTAYYRLSPQGEVTRIGMAPEPNGIALSPDGHFLYVSSTGGDPVRRYTLDDAGAAVGAATVFSPLSSDGMGMDCAGNVYLSNAGTIKVLSPQGMMLGSITGLGTATVSNSAFGGPDGKTLYITTAAALYQIQLNVPGFPD